MTSQNTPNELPPFRHFACTLPDGTTRTKRSRFAEFTQVVVTKDEEDNFGMFRWTSSEKTANRDLRLAKKADGVADAFLIECTFTHEEVPELPEGVFATKKAASAAAKEQGRRAKDVEKTDEGWIVIQEDEAQATG